MFKIQKQNKIGRSLVLLCPQPIRFIIWVAELYVSEDVRKQWLPYIFWNQRGILEASGLAGWRTMIIHWAIIFCHSATRRQLHSHLDISIWKNIFIGVITLRAPFADKVGRTGKNRRKGSSRNRKRYDEIMWGENYIYINS